MCKKQSILSLITAASVIAFTASCSKETEEGITSGDSNSSTPSTSDNSDKSTEEFLNKISGDVSLTAYQPSNDVKIGFTSNGYAYWQANDAIAVWSKGEGKFKSFGISGNAGLGVASFSGKVQGGMGGNAVFPYDEKHNLSDSILTFHLPDSYIYTSVDTTYFPESKNGQSFNMPLIGKVSEKMEVTFKHLGAVLCMTIDRMPDTNGTVTVTESSNALAGDFTATLTDETPEIKTAVADKGHTVTFAYSNATKNQKGIFYLPVATGKYNLTVEVKGSDANKASSTTTHQVEASRATLNRINIATSYSAIIDGHKFIDLALPSGLLWAETNIGAATATDCGNYFAWGETDARTGNFSTAGYTYYDETTKAYTKYNSSDAKKTLDTGDDAAIKTWGTYCRMPSNQDMQELLANCTFTWNSETASDGTTQVYGCKVTSNKNGQSIFLPTTGYYNNNAINEKSVEGDYWTSTCSDSDAKYAKYLRFQYSNKNLNTEINASYRYQGRVIRAVTDSRY